MSFRELIKGAAHRYIKRVPKAGGGYKYYYKEHHGGGVIAQKHFKEGAAFKLTHNGQEGHFHITEAGEGELKVRHDESGREVTLSPDDLEALLRAQHGAALEDNARQKRAKAEKIKRTKPDSLAAAAAEKRAEAAEAKAGGKPPTKPTQEQEPPETAEQVEQAIKRAIDQERPRQLKQRGEKITSVKPFENINARALFAHALKGLGREARALVFETNTPEIQQRISDIYRAFYKKGARVDQAREQAYPLILEQMINAVESIDLNTFFEGNPEGLAKIKRRINTLNELKAKGAPAPKPARP